MRTIRLPSFFFSSLIVVGVFVILTAAFGQQRSFAYQQQTPHKSGASTADRGSQSNRTTATEIYAVVDISDEIKVMLKSDIKIQQKKLDLDYKQDMNKYQEAKKDKKNPDANILKKPDKKDYTVKTLRANFKTKEDAQKFAEEKIQEREKAAQKTTTSKW